MEFIQRAAFLNMEGALYLEARDHATALASFNSAIACMSTAARNLFHAHLAQKLVALLFRQPVGGLSASASPLKVMALPVPARAAATSYGADEDSPERNPEHFVYRRALIFRPEHDGDPVDALFFSAVVIFNTAVCFHKEDEDALRDDLHKAASLYEICLELLKDSTTRFDCSQVIICAMNNKACSHIALGDLNKASGIFDQLLSVIVSCDGTPQSLSKTDMEGIMHNILLLKSSCVSPAA